MGKATNLALCRNAIWLRNDASVLSRSRPVCSSWRPSLRTLCHRRFPFQRSTPILPTTFLDAILSAQSISDFRRVSCRPRHRHQKTESSHRQPQRTRMRRWSHENIYHQLRSFSHLCHRHASQNSLAFAVETGILAVDCCYCYRGHRRRRCRC